MSTPQPSFEDYDAYIGDLFALEDEVLQGTRKEMQAAGLRPINISPTGGRLLQLLARMIGAQRILEIGTLGGYSAIWLARALPPGGKLVSLEIDEHHAAVARRNLAAAGLAAVVEVRVGPALTALAAMQQAGDAPFDLAFIDADKDGYVAYLEKALALVRDGGLILADNTLRPEMLDPAGDGGAKRYNAAVGIHPGLFSTIVPVLRSEGLDGLTISIKQALPPTV
jgi:predicted O-methyltransferase YrrM